MAQEMGFLNSGAPKESRSLLPWAIAGLVVALVVAALLLFGRKPAPVNPGGAGLAPTDPYASSLTISNIRMSESSSLSGAKQTYIDGDIANHGTKMLTGITVQVGFHDFTGQLAQKETMPMALIRTHTPYIDTEPVSMAPVAPGETREFRLILDYVTDSWNQAYPEIRVIGVQEK
jgi:hypothetical protein